MVIKNRITCIVLLALGLLIGGAGCDSDDGNTSTGGTIASQSSSGGQQATMANWIWLESKAARLGYDESSNRLALFNGEDQRLSIALQDIQMGFVSQIDDTYGYDPTYLRPEFGPLEPPGFEWLNPTFMKPSTGEKTLSFDFETMGKTGSLIFTIDEANRFEATLTPPEGLPIAFLKVSASADKKEGFYGLGEVFDVVNHRGKIRPMHILPEPEVESVINDVHAPIPLLLGSSGWGLFVKTYYPTVFEVAVDDDTTVAFAVATAGEGKNNITFHLFVEDNPLDLTRHFYEMTGWPKLPAEWALGPWVWRDENRDQEQVSNDIKTMRELDLATSGYWIDRPYASGVNSFDFKESQFPKPQKMIDEIQAHGYRFALWHTPYISDEEANQELKAYAEENGFYPPGLGLLLSKWGPLIDLTNEDAYAWWQSLIKRYTDMGVEGFKLDYGEEVVPGIQGLRSGWTFADGSTDRTMHAVYQYWYHKVYADLMPETGGFMLTRTATWGDQVNGLIIWPGDLDATMTKRYDMVEKDGKTYGSVGGLPAALVAGLSLGPSGFPFYGSDTGGYRNAPPNKETFTRWFQQTALSTVMQIGTNTNDVAWEFKDENGFDEEMLNWYRRYTRLHLRLFPYEWTYAQQILTTGRAIQRPYGLQYPQLNHHVSDTYFFGDDLLVAPVLEAGARSRSVQFPPGVWYDWWTGEAFESDTPVTVDAPLETLPLYLRAGGIIPLLRPTIDTLATTTVDGIESYADDPGQLYVRMALGADHSFELFDGARISIVQDGARATIETQAGRTFQNTVRLEIVGLEAAPKAVKDDNEVLTPALSLESLDEGDGWFYEASQRRLSVQVSMGRSIAIESMD